MCFQTLGFLILKSTIIAKHCGEEPQGKIAAWTYGELWQRTNKHLVYCLDLICVLYVPFSL